MEQNTTSVKEAERGHPLRVLFTLQEQKDTLWASIWKKRERAYNRKENVPILPLLIRNTQSMKVPITLTTQPTCWVIRKDCKTKKFIGELEEANEHMGVDKIDCPEGISWTRREDGKKL